MVFQNELTRHVTHIEYNEETQGWEVIFVDQHNVARQCSIPHIPYAGNNVAKALQIIIANYCVNNADESNLWIPTAGLEHVAVDPTEISDTQAITILFQNGLEFIAQHIGPPTNIYEVVENLVVRGIHYYNKDAGCKFQDVDSDGLDEHVRVIKMFENPNKNFALTLHLQDHACQPVTDDQIAKSVPHYLNAVMLLAGMYNSQIHVTNTNHACFVPSDFTCPKFEILHHTWFNPSAILYEDMSAMLYSDNGTLLVSINS